MDRRSFIQNLFLTPLLSKAMNNKEFENLIGDKTSSDKMPVLFVGHGNPMNAITDNKYRTKWEEIGKKLNPPKAILCISAHWQTKGTAVTLAEKPKTIHDFGGFPKELFQVQYPAPGAVDYAQLAISTVQSTKIHEDFEWGLDHGAWSVLRNMYPKADVPVFQMSLDYTHSQSPLYHYNLAKELASLRNKGVLIVSSGNVVHNLGALKWGDNSQPYDWALEFDHLVKKSLEDNNPTPLIEYQKLGNVAQMAHPTNEHYLPLMYTLGLRQQNDELHFFNDNFDLGSLSMRSVLLQ